MNQIAFYCLLLVAFRDKNAARTYKLFTMQAKFNTVSGEGVFSLRLDSWVDEIYDQQPSVCFSANLHCVVRADSELTLQMSPLQA